MQNAMFPQMGQRLTRSSLRVIKLLVINSGTFNPMYLRPYETHYNHNVESALQRSLQENNGRTASSLLTGIANQFMMPAMQHNGQANIVNGWEQPRAKFSMIVEVRMETGTIYYYQLQGFTSHYDLSHGGHIDPDTVFYVNSYTRTSRTEIQGPMGREVREMITESAQVINGRLVKSMLPTEMNVFGLRPGDMYAAMQTDAISGRMNPHDNAMIYDSRRALSMNSVPSERSNNMPTQLVARMIDSYQAGSQQMDVGHDISDKYTRSRGYVDESNFFAHPFFRNLSDVSGEPEATSFQLKDLLQLDNNAMRPEVAQFIKLNAQGMMKIPRVGETQTWHNPADRTAWISSVLINTVPTILIELGVSVMTFSATNEGQGGQNMVVINGAMDIAGTNISRNLDVFKTRFIHEVMRGLTHQNAVTYQLFMSVDLYGHTTIDISYDSSPMTRYVAPSFADSLFSPIITTNENILRSNAHDFNRILENVNAASGGFIPSINPDI